MTIIIKFKLLFTIFLVVILFACQQPTQHFQNKPHQSETKLKILTTIAPLYCFTINITGDIADVENLLPSGVGPHEYSFKPSDVRKVTRAQVLIKNGVNLESWSDNLIISAGKKGLVVVDTSSGVKIIDNDPHIWVSPRNAIIQVRNITDVLVNVDPEHSKIYRENAENYIKRLEALDMGIKEEVSKWRRKKFVAFHSAFLYFARDYGLTQAAVIQEFPEKEPTPKHIASVINTIKTTGIKVIFSESQSSHKILEAIAKDLNLQVLSLDTLETGDFYIKGSKWYENRVRENINTLRKVLGRDIE